MQPPLRWETDSISEHLQACTSTAALVLALFIVIVSGALISAVDPGIKTVGDGIWYAWVTMATVGYGDVVPVSPAGRVIGAILILLGLVLFSLITANIAAFLLSGDVERVEQEETATARRLNRIQEQLDRIERCMERLDGVKRRVPPRRTRVVADGVRVNDAGHAPSMDDVQR
ncbi:MAG: potassium channel family protein [Gammaproteobacteria bacterium]